MAEFVDVVLPIEEKNETETNVEEQGKDEMPALISAAEVSTVATSLNNATAAEEMLKLLMKSQSQKSSKKEEKKDFLFWNTQPVPKMDQKFFETGPIDANTDTALVKQEPYSMPAGFEWCSLDVKNPVEIEEMYKLLTENYVEDDDNMFRFDYSIPFLHWALTPPGYLKDWHLGVRSQKSGKLMALITAAPAEMRVYEQILPMVEINFLCVHKKLRSKRLAPVLIKEVTRRVNVAGRWQAVYTAGAVLPKPVARCRYYHRSLNPKKLIEVNFSRLQARMTMARTIKLYKLPDTLSTDLREMAPEDVPSVCTLLNNYLNRTSMAPVFSVEDCAHWLLPRPGVINSFVISDASGTVTDLCSFYHLPSSVMGNPKHDRLKSAYSYYNVATTVELVDLMRESLILARNLEADVFNALDLMENRKIFEPLKFGIGDGHLQYYLYNYKCPDLVPENVGLVLL